MSSYERKSKWKNQCTNRHIRFVSSSIAKWLEVFVENFFFRSNSVSYLALKVLPCSPDVIKEIIVLVSKTDFFSKTGQDRNKDRKVTIGAVNMRCDKMMISDLIQTDLAAMTLD